MARASHYRFRLQTPDLSHKLGLRCAGQQFRQDHVASGQRNRETLNVTADQIGAPTGADLIADITAPAIQKVIEHPELGGMYHLAASGEVSWHGYASHVIEFARSHGEQLAVKAINPIDSAAYPTPARRPLNSRLNTQKLRDNFSLHLPDWQSGVTRMLMEVLNK